MRLLGLIPVLLFLAAGFVTAFYPRVLPRLTNIYYSKIGMKTRVVEEDYERLPTRTAGGILLIIGIFVAYRFTVSGH